MMATRRCGYTVAVAVTSIPLGPFELHEPIGSGGMGQVWRATHREQAVAVAVKVITIDRARDEALLSAFRDEVRAVAGLDHPNIIQVFDHGQIPREAEEASRGQLASLSPYLVMELADGGSVQSLRGKLPWARIRELLGALLDALAHAHARGVVHRDIKPANLLFGGERLGVKLSDFGFVHALEGEWFDRSDVDTSGILVYMVPEQIEWLQKELEGSREDWKIAYFHHPLYSSGGRHGSDIQLREVLEPLFLKHNVSVVLTGHDHFYERVKPQQGIVYFVVGAGGKLRSGNIEDRSPLTAKGFDTDYSFMVAEIAGDQMYFNAISRAGTVIDSGVVTRRK